MRQAAFPHAQRLKRRHRAGQQGRCPVISLRRRGDKERLDTGCLKRDRTDEPGRAGANDRHFGGKEGGCVHILNQVRQNRDRQKLPNRL